MWNVVGFKPVFDCGTWGFGCFTVIDDLGPGSKLLAVICWISVIHEYLPNNGETWDDRVEDLRVENTRLESEVNKLHKTLATIKEEARREILTLKEAILIMAKHHEEE